MKRFPGILALGSLALVLSACGGGGSGGSPGDVPIILAGVAEDGPVAGARVFLQDSQSGGTARICGASGIGRCETVSGSAGSFSFQLQPGAQLDGLEVVTIGGMDRETGTEFAGIRMLAPVDLFRGREEQVTVSPLTSLLAARQRLPGNSPDLALEQLRRWLDLGPTVDLTAPLAADTELLRRSLLLTGLALELAREGESDPFAAIASRLNPDLPLLSGVGGLADLGLDAAASARITELSSALQAATDNLTAVFRKTVIAQGLGEISGRLLADESGFNPADPQYLANLGLLADKIVQAAGQTVIPLGSGLTPQRIARYVLFTYGLTSFADFTVEPAAFAAALVHPDTGKPLEQDPQIAELAAVNSLYSAAVPLLDDEIPGDDNGRRLAYFYNSDLSPFYFAEKVSGEILDDQFSDSVMLAIAAGKAEAGLLAEAAAIVDTQIYQAQDQGDGYYSLAEALIGFGRFPEAIAALKKAEGLYRKVIETKGYASIGSSDTIHLQRVGSAYRRAGDLASSQAVIDYLAAMAPYLTTPNEYGSIIVGTWQLVDEYLAAGHSDLAAPLVDFMYDFALQTPPNVSGGNYYFKAKILYLLETAKRYAALGNLQRVAEIYQQIQAIRANDGYQNLTAGKTWRYMVDAVELLYRLGRSDEAYALAGEMPDAYALQAFKLVATYEAVNNGMATALAVIDAHIPLVADKIEALTYFANNTSREYVALALINRDLLDGARQALAEACRQMAYLTPATDADRYQQMIRQGYVKIAGLYALAGDPATAAALLQEAETALDAMSGLTSRVEGLTDIALGYHGLGNDARAGELLDRAGAEIAGMLAATAPPADPGAAGSFYLEVAKSYELLIDTCLDSGFRQQGTAYIDPYAAVIRLIFEPGASYAGDDHDKFAGLETGQMLEAAGFLLTAGDPEGAAALLGEAEATAGQIWVEATRIGKFIDDRDKNIIGSYAAAGRFDRALTLARSLPYAADRNLALQTIATTYAGRDDFPDSWVASIDSDHDGQPDFFNPLAAAADIAASGLVLDADSDGDGIPDQADRRPLMADQAAL